MVLGIAQGLTLATAIRNSQSRKENKVAEKAKSKFYDFLETYAETHNVNHWAGYLNGDPFSPFKQYLTVKKQVKILGFIPDTKDIAVLVINKEPQYETGQPEGLEVRIDTNYKTQLLDFKSSFKEEFGTDVKIEYFSRE
jgi:hypothetical protein